MTTIGMIALLIYCQLQTFSVLGLVFPFYSLHCCWEWFYAPTKGLSVKTWHQIGDVWKLPKGAERNE